MIVCDMVVVFGCYGDVVEDVVVVDNYVNLCV